MYGWFRRVCDPHPIIGNALRDAPKRLNRLWYRKNQYRAVLADTGSQAEPVVVGGDFNSFTEAAVRELEDDFWQAGFVRVPKDSGSTVVKFGIEVSSDHIFAKGFVLEEAGKMAKATASDHLPIWVTLIPNY